MFKEIERILKSKILAYFFMCHYLCLLSLVVGLIAFKLLEVGEEIGETLVVFSMLVSIILGVSSSIRYFSQPRLGFFEVMAFMEAPLFIIGCICVVTNVFFKTAIMVYTELIKAGII